MYNACTKAMIINEKSTATNRLYSTEVKDFSLTSASPISFTGLASPEKYRTEVLTLALQKILLIPFLSLYMGATRLTQFVVVVEYRHCRD